LKGAITKRRAQVDPAGARCRMIRELTLNPAIDY
jgi:hypothetical protein